MKETVLTTPCYQLYQDLVNRIFGDDVIAIKQDEDNIIIGTLKYVNCYLEFKKNLEARLTRLKTRYEGTPSYTALLETVKQLADHRNWEGAYAELVAYDVMSNSFLSSNIELNKTMPVTASFAGEMGGSETNEDGFVSDYDFYFDVKILADTVKGILMGIIHEAVKRAGQEGLCNILPEYPIDDDEQQYQKKRKLLVEELQDFILSKRLDGNNGKVCMKSNHLPFLYYRIIWGSGVNSAEGEYNPYRHAEKCKHLIFKRYIKKFMKHKPFFLVMVNFPWYNNLVKSFINADEVFYRSISRRTFCEYKNLSTAMSSIEPRYKGKETVFEVSNHLTGLIFIDDHSIKKDKYTCHIYLNPNATNKLTFGRSYLEQLVSQGCCGGIIDDMEYDNY